MRELIGYHGTDGKNYESIVKNSFRATLGDEEWLGDGVYFFTEGVPPEPYVHAENWAIVQSWDKASRRYIYSSYCIIGSQINVKEDYLLDLTVKDGLEIFNYLRYKYVKKIRQARKKLRNGEFKDGHLINLASSEIDIRIDVAMGNFYIKFTDERICNVQFRTPNCTIIAVRNLNCLDKQSMHKYKEGQI